MEINAIDSLTPLREVLQAPAEDQERLFEEKVMKPLKPLWSSFLRFGPAAGTDPDAPGAGLQVARRFQFFLPEHGAEAGLQALGVLEQANSWENCVAGLRKAEQALQPAAHGVNIPEVIFSSVLSNPAMSQSQVDGGAGYTGVGNIPGFVLVMSWPTAFNIPRLPSAVAHEFNHNVRLSVEPWGMDTSVGQYIVLEGLAESFAAELFGQNKLGPWAQALTEQQAAEVRPRMKDALEVTGFNEIRGYIFGDWAAGEFSYKAQGLPNFAGYTIGYQLVQAYLQQSGLTAAEATYVPWREIVAGANYF